jgi:tetratricopeptide (TPR) repeat protein
MSRSEFNGTRGLWLVALAAGLLFALAQFTATPALAFGGGGGGSSSSSSKPSCPVGWHYSSRCKACAKPCRSGYVWSCGRKSCVQRGGELLNDQDLYAEAVSLIEAGEYKTALSFLWLIEKRDDPKVLNYIGYTTRRLGNVDDGIKYYHRAIALDPDYVRAREYLGEGYLQRGELGAASAQLAEIEDRCGRGCVEYQALATAIADYKAGNFSAERSW